MTISANRRAVVCAAAAGVGLALACSTSPRSRTGPPFRVVERWVDRFDRGQAASPDDRDAGLAATAQLRWTAAEIARHWTRATVGRGATFRSPRLDVGTVDDLEALAVMLHPGTSRAILLWNDQPALSRADYTKNRRDLLPRPDQPSRVVVRTKDIRGDTASPFRYLFVHLPDATRPDAVIDAIAVVRRAELFDVKSAGRARLAIAGEIRDVAYNAASTIEWPVDVPPRAELRIGFHAGRQAAATAATVTYASVTFTAGGETTAVFDTTTAAEGWRDIRAALPAGPGHRPPDGRSRRRACERPLVRSDDRGAVDGAPPNVVLYVVDALRADRLGAYGSPKKTSPFLDDLARRSLLFRRSYAAASWTKPSVATLLTSLFPHTHRLGARYYTDPLPDAVPTLQRALRDTGYVTAQFSANALAGTLSNLDRGFDQTMAPDAFATAGSAPGAKISAGALNARLLPWVDAHADDTFFVYVQSLEPHEPRAPTPPGRDPFDAYDAGVSINDREIGRLYQHLVDLGLASRTLFIVTSDHGEAFGEHGQWGHGLSVHEEEVRVPLIVHWPGTIAPAIVDEPVSLVDVLPTVLDYCQVSFDPAHVQGRSLVPGSHAGQTRRPLLTTRFVYPEDIDVQGADHMESQALVDFPWKLIATDADPKREPRYELYDLSRDPLEHDNRAAAEPDRVRRLAAALTTVLQAQAAARTRFLEAYGSPALEPRRVPSRDVLEQLKSLGYIR
ncbi:MAG: sulfatase [Acidobacteria bacterium]|nr:sulfatase [Acidobacteriota bacterium]